MTDYEAAYGHLLTVFLVLIIGALLLSDGVTTLGLILWAAAILLTAFAPLLFDLLRTSLDRIP